MKKFFVLFVVLVAILLCNSIYAGKNPTKGVVTTTDSQLNVRSGPGMGYPVIACLDSGVSVSINDASGGWYKVSGGGCSGYVSSAFVKVTESEEIDYSSLPKEEQEKIGMHLNKSADAAKISSTVAE